jgi:hypothetical protein
MERAAIAQRALAIALLVSLWKRVSSENGQSQASVR